MNVMSHQATSWLNCYGTAFFRRVGIQPTHHVLDFGCSDGRYAIPAAKAVGPEGCIYAVDKNAEALKTLKKKIRELRIDNIHVLRVVDSDRLPVPRGEIDVVLLYDVLHGGYFPEANQRIDLLVRIYDVIKAGGILSCYLTHLKSHGLTFRQLHEEICSVGFRLESKARRKLVHDNDIVRGLIFQYRKS